VAEELTFALMLEQLQKLHIAFPSHAGMKANPRATAEVYRDGLQGLSGEAFRAAARIAIENGKFFPKIGELRESAAEWTRRHNVDVNRDTSSSDPLWCPNCKTNAEWRWRHRPLVDERLAPIFSPDNEYLLLVRFSRLLCRCASECLFTPDDEVVVAYHGFEYAAIRAERVKWSYGRQDLKGRSSAAPKKQQPLTPNVGAIAEQLVETVAIQTEDFAHA
jgi:hypothetical protein